MLDSKRCYYLTEPGAEEREVDKNQWWSVLIRSGFTRGGHRNRLAITGFETLSGVRGRVVIVSAAERMAERDRLIALVAGDLT
jgi:hypothetical protein